MIFIILNNAHNTRVRLDHVVSYEPVAGGTRTTVRDATGVLHYSDETIETFEKRIDSAFRALGIVGSLVDYGAAQ